MRTFALHALQNIFKLNCKVIFNHYWYLLLPSFPANEWHFCFQNELLRPWRCWLEIAIFRKNFENMDLKRLLQLATHAWLAKNPSKQAKKEFQIAKEKAGAVVVSWLTKLLTKSSREIPTQKEFALTAKLASFISRGPNSHTVQSRLSGVLWYYSCFWLVSWSWRFVAWHSKFINFADLLDWKRGKFETASQEKVWKIVSSSLWKT